MLQGGKKEIEMYQLSLDRSLEDLHGFDRSQLDLTFFLFPNVMYLWLPCREDPLVIRIMPQAKELRDTLMNCRGAPGITRLFSSTGVLSMHYDTGLQSLHTC